MLKVFNRDSIEVFAHLFIAKDIYNRLHVCRWDEALGYKNKVEVIMRHKFVVIEGPDGSGKRLNVHCYRVSYTGGVIFHGFAIYQDWKLVLLEE